MVLDVKRFENHCSNVLPLIHLQAEEEVAFAKGVYESINSDLKEELPTLFDRSETIFPSLHDLFRSCF